VSASSVSPWREGRSSSTWAISCRTVNRCRSERSAALTVIMCRPFTHIVLPASPGFNRLLKRTSAFTACAYFSRSTGTRSMPALRTKARARTMAVASVISLLEDFDIDVIELSDPVLGGCRPITTEADLCRDQEGIDGGNRMLQHRLEQCVRHGGHSAQALQHPAALRGQLQRIGERFEHLIRGCGLVVILQTLDVGIVHAAELIELAQAQPSLLPKPLQRIAETNHGL